MEDWGGPGGVRGLGERMTDNTFKLSNFQIGTGRDGRGIRKGQEMEDGMAKMKASSK